MTDDRLRRLERAWLETGDIEDRKALDRERARVGLPSLPRLSIVHYIDDPWHGRLDGDGKLISGAGRERWPTIKARCSVELWPRDLLKAFATMRKVVHYTEDPAEVTCKTCSKSLNKPDKPDRQIFYRTHYAPGSKDGRDRGITPVPVCGRDDSDKFTQTFTWRMLEMNCPACKRIMERGRRASRRP